MKFLNYTLSIRVLKYILDHPNCTVPQIRDDFGIGHLKPISRQEKDLYKVVSYLHLNRFINKVENNPISSGGAHFYLKSTQKGMNLIYSFKTLFQDIIEDYSIIERILNKRMGANPTDLSMEFSRFTLRVLEGFLKDILNELPQDPKRFLVKEKLKRIMDFSHSRLQNKMSSIIDNFI